MVTLYTTYFNVQELCILLTHFVFIFLMIVTIDSYRINKLLAFITQTWRREDSSVGIAILLRPGSPWDRSSVPSRGKRVHCYFTASWSALGPIQPFVQRDRVSFPRGKTAGAWDWPATSMSIEIKNAWSCASTHPSVFTTSYLIKQRDNFTRSLCFVTHRFLARSVVSEKRIECG